VNQDFASERRRCVRQKVNTPAFASFDGVTGGMILDLSEEGMAMQAVTPLETSRRMAFNLSLGEPAAHLETTGYVAWADALGRAGVHFSDLPDEARARLREWLTLNASSPSWKAPRWVVRNSALHRNSFAARAGTGLALNLEAASQSPDTGVLSTTVQYEFNSLAGDLPKAMNLIASRACSITRGTGAAVALSGECGMTCRAVAGNNVPKIGSEVDIDSGFSGECIRLLRPLRCDDAASDSRANTEACHHLEIRSVLAAPIVYERDLVGLLEVFSTRPYAFDDGDLAVVERLAQTVVLTLSRAEAFR
jgi:hypothetical protein